LVGPGFNSGWSEIQGNQNKTTEYSDDRLAFGGKSHYSHPELASIPSMGLTGLSFLDSDKYGAHYENDLLVGDFHNGFLYHFELSRERTELNLTSALGDKIADNMKELDQNILGRGFGGITDIDVGPDGYLYILSLYRGGDDCPTMLPEEEVDVLINKKVCIDYDSELQGTLFRIVPRIE
jgi:glucose/arabinose dehydrogenase